MVLQKRLDYGFNGYQVPAMPRGSRSARGKHSFKKKVEDNQICAFDLLATVAGKLLGEKENSLTPINISAGISKFPIGKDTIKQEQRDVEKPFKQEPCDQGSCDESVIAFNKAPQRNTQTYASNKYLHAQDDVTLRSASRIIKSERSEKVACAEESINQKSRNEFGNSVGLSHGKCNSESGSPGYAESHGGKTEDEFERRAEAENKGIRSVINKNSLDMCSSEDPIELDTKPPVLVSSGSSVEVPLCGDHIPCGSHPRCQYDVNVLCRDDDENSSGCTQPSTISMKAFRSPRLGDRRIRKLRAPKFLKVAPKLLKDGELSNTDLEMKPVFRSKKMCYTRQRTQSCFPFKKRKLFERCSLSTSDGGISSEGVSNSSEKGVDGNPTCLGATMHGASGASSSITGQKSSFKSGDSHVKLSINSFRVPDLFIEISETETVASLKRTVLEAVTAILGGGLRVGVLYQGKKVKDDTKTLLQTGISQADTMDSLGFTLEPNPARTPSPLPTNDPHCLTPCDATQPLTRNHGILDSDRGEWDASPDLPLTNPGNSVESDHDSVLSPTDMKLDKTPPNSRALVAIPTMSVEALAMVPLHRKSRRSELVQRRIRRPFSVSEVEALVHAVEKLGTGRWRDVKLRAFENEKHRTYVDLKDKWKTLVHTAKIAPQQRRGEPVPQELLDRVLSAHAYWSQQQAKLQQVKQHSDTCLLL
ncbi:telomere repeat-binding protein 5-like [Tasmannia lanceolata]|uniref:telomere repeat-binding protein 5-like n=1 Tax=Tasmannia lanceolata TaxID=3420 RepID=UPI00406394E5